MWWISGAAASAARVIRPRLLPSGYVAVLPTPYVVRHSETGIVLSSDPQAVPADVLASHGTFTTLAVKQSWAPAALVASLSEDQLANEHGDEVITVLVMPRAAVPSAMADLLSRQPISAPIPASVPDETLHHRGLKERRGDFIVEVRGDFTKEEILRFAKSVDLDVDDLNLMLGREKR